MCPNADDTEPRSDRDRRIVRNRKIGREEADREGLPRPRRRSPDGRDGGSRDARCARPPSGSHETREHRCVRRGGPRRRRPGRRAREQRGLRLLRRGRGDSDGRGACADGRERVRARAHDATGLALDAPPSERPHPQRHVDSAARFGLRSARGITHRSLPSRASPIAFATKCDPSESTSS